MGYRPISSRLTSIQIKASPFNITIVQAYASTTDHDDEELEEFYVQIQRAFGALAAQWLAERPCDQYGPIPSEQNDNNRNSNVWHNSSNIRRDNNQTINRLLHNIKSF
ncbi:endonuclease-reverse transcriptase [Plakobranchus ocellatus]|uniref:Endonuclease-reverse transcriptase n=1 Tax=Plakobranchus ocellatus TaxID=259542 RepID=A0AAV3ZV94_9GAST|nr:endonuclease-reverse transcriptase [Plakobranchus ocellatus]